MNYEYLERTVIANLLMDTLQYSRVNVEMFYLDEYISLYEIGKKLNETTGSNYISRVEILGYIDTNWGKYNLSPRILDTMYDLIDNELAPKTAKARKQEFQSALSRLSERTKISDVRMTLQHADMLAAEGKLTEAIVEARSLTLSSNRQLVSTEEIILNSVKMTTGIESGIDGIDAKLGGWHRGNIISIMGDVGTYKTQVSLWMALQALKRNPKLTAVYFEKEMSTNDIGRRIMSVFAKVTAYEVMEANNKKDEEQIEILRARINFALNQEEAKDILSRLTIIGAESFDNATDMFEYVDYHRFDIVVLDFLTMLGDNKSLSDNQLYFFFLKQMQIIKAMTLSCDTVTILINQLKKNALGQRMIKIPNREDIEWGSQVNQYSAYMFSTLYPVKIPQLENLVSNRYYYLVCQKNRHGMSNLDIPIMVNPEYFEFSNPHPIAKKEMLAWLANYKLGRNIYESNIRENKEHTTSGSQSPPELFRGLRPKANEQGDQHDTTSG